MPLLFQYFPIALIIIGRFYELDTWYSLSTNLGKNVGSVAVINIHLALCPIKYRTVAIIKPVSLGLYAYISSKINRVRKLR